MRALVTLYHDHPLVRAGAGSLAGLLLTSLIATGVLGPLTSTGVVVLIVLALGVGPGELRSALGVLLASSAQDPRMARTEAVLCLAARWLIACGLVLAALVPPLQLELQTDAIGALAQLELSTLVLVAGALAAAARVGGCSEEHLGAHHGSPSRSTARELRPTRPGQLTTAATLGSAARPTAILEPAQPARTIRTPGARP